LRNFYQNLLPFSKTTNFSSPVSNANTDAGGRCVAVVEGGVLAEVDAGGSGVGYSGVVDRKVGWVKDG
jgi:hypothetical protein